MAWSVLQRNDWNGEGYVDAGFAGGGDVFSDGFVSGLGDKFYTNDATVLKGKFAEY